MEKLGRLPGYEFREEDQVTVRGEKRRRMLGPTYNVCLSVVLLETGFTPSVAGFTLNGDSEKIRQLLSDLQHELDRLEAAPMPTEIVGLISGFGGSSQQEPQ